MTRNAKDAWKGQKELQQKYRADEVPDLRELYTIVQSIRLGKVDQVQQTLRAKALFVMYYLTGCRRSEVTICNKLWRKDPTKKKAVYKWLEHDYPGILKRSIDFDEIDGRKVMYIRTENRKNKKRTTKRQPIPIELEANLVQVLKDYLNTLGDDAVLFPFKPRRAYGIIKDTTGFNVHFIRHIRCTHLVTVYDFNEQSLIKFMGWTDARPAKAYMELQSKDVFRQFYKNKN